MTATLSFIRVWLKTGQRWQIIAAWVATVPASEEGEHFTKA